MNHHLRQDKTCLNCGANVEERYCPRCGQENLEPKESFGRLISHFFSDLTHYDSKLFITVKNLLGKPGFLTKEYLAGKRLHYLHPIRIYVFVSFLYFLMILGFNTHKNEMDASIAKNASQVVRSRIMDSLQLILASEKKHGI
jgi:hypothetical protein